MTTREKLPAGTFIARVTSVDDVQYGSATSGNPQIGVQLEILSEGFEGRKVTWFGTFPPGGDDKSTTTCRISCEALRAMGWKTNLLDDLSGITDNEVELWVKYEDYNGRESMKVNVSVPGEGGKPRMKNQLDQGGKAAFAQRMAGFASTIPKRDVPKLPFT